jgi:hypothetical protein
VTNGTVQYIAVTTGISGNSIKVQHYKAGNNTPLTISVVGTDITVGLATSATGAISCTANQVAVAVNSDPLASLLVKAVTFWTGNGLVKDTSGFVSLTGGLDQFEDATFVESERILERVLERLAQVQPGHTELAVSFRANLTATLTLTATVEPT